MKKLINLQIEEFILDPLVSQVAITGVIILRSYFLVFDTIPAHAVCICMGLIRQLEQELPGVANICMQPTKF